MSKKLYFENTSATKSVHLTFDNTIVHLEPKGMEIVDCQGSKISGNVMAVVTNVIDGKQVTTPIDLQSPCTSVTTIDPDTFEINVKAGETAVKAFINKYHVKTVQPQLNPRFMRPSSTASKTTKKSNTTMYIIIAIVVLLIILVGAYFYFSSGENTLKKRGKYF